MSFPKLETLNGFDKSQLEQINRFLAEAYEEGLIRFSPLLLKQKSNLSDDRSIEALLKCTQRGILKINYEIQCPQCESSDAVVNRLEEIPVEEIKCRVWDDPYTPEPKFIWVTFDFLEKPKTKKRKSDRIKVSDYKSESSVCLAEIGRCAYFEKNFFFVPKQFFRIDLEHYRTLLEAMKNAQTNDEKKKTLEKLSAYLIECSGIFQVVGVNVRTPTAELDIIASISAPPGTFVQNWGDLLIIECKNWIEPANSQVIKTLEGNLSDSHSEVGILFSKSGVTGSNGEDAVGQIKNIFVRSQRIILVFSEHDLEKIAQGENFLSIMAEKYINLKF